VAVCLLPGTEVAFESEVQREVTGFYPRFLKREPEYIRHKVARFRQVNVENPHTHHDAVEFPDGQIVLLTHLRAGQHASVLQLPAQAKSAADVADVEAQAGVEIPRIGATLCSQSWLFQETKAAANRNILDCFNWNTAFRVPEHSNLRPSGGWLLKAQFLDHVSLAFGYTERSDCRARNEPEEIADLEGCCDQSDCQHHRPDVIAIRNSDRCGAHCHQTNRRKRHSRPCRAPRFRMGNTPEPSATSSPQSAISWNDMTSLASQMVSSDAKRMLAMKAQRAMSSAPPRP
jgi:hypothetical protein